MYTRPARTPFAVVSIFALIATLFAAVAASPAGAAPVVIASDMTGSPSVGLISHTNPWAGGFTSAADGFEKYQRSVSPSIPFALLDDTLVSFPADTAGIVDDNNLTEFFGVVDTVNGDTTGPVSASWRFDISGGTNLAVSIDMGAMGDFEAADAFEWSASIDGGPAFSVFSLVADEAASLDYTLANGTTVTTLSDPLTVNALTLSNIFTTVSASIPGAGAELELTLTATADGGSEGVVFQNLIVTSDDGGGSDPVPGDLVITEIMQNPAAVSDAAGEWFEITNVSGTNIDLDGWTIADEDFDSHVITNSGPLVVPAGGALVLGNNGDGVSNGGVTVAYQYSGMFLSNSADEVLLVDPNATVFDQVNYDGGPVFPDPTGASMSLSGDATSRTENDDGANWCQADAPYGAGDLGTPGAANPTCPDEPLEITLIHDIQGSGSDIAVVGPVALQGIVTGLIEDDDAPAGFFVQEEDADADADPATSEGIYVFCRGNCPAGLAVGDIVTVTGDASDFFDNSQVNMLGGNATIESSGNALPTPAVITLPASGATDDAATFEATEDMLVTVATELVVSEYFELARYGQIVLTETSRPYQYTHTNTPDPAGYAAFLEDLATRQIILDDNNSDQNDAIFGSGDEPYFYPEGGLSATNRFRGGDTITGLTGVMDWSFDNWRIRPTPEAFDYTFTPANLAPTSAPEVGGSIQVASFNVLNYFATLDDNVSTCGPNALGCRGANSLAEQTRQRDKIVSALVAIDADVVGLIELENDAYDTSIAQLVAGVNAIVGAGTYDYIETGYIGLDAIKVGIIYKPATVAPAGDFAVLDSSIDPTFVDTENRPVLIQTFDDIATGERFTVAVNHLKSKGSDCDALGDPNLSDGQANCSQTRTAGAVALANYLDTDPTGSRDPDFLILGDLNSYAMEDPIMALAAAGYTDLLGTYGGSAAYTFVFDSQLGYLDYALANAAILDQVTGAAAWAINADEPSLFDYNDDVRDAGEASFQRKSGALPLYTADALRSSDHDPVLVGLALDSIPDNPTCFGQPATIVGTPGDDTIYGTNKADVIVTFGGDDTVFAGNGKDLICTGYGNDVVYSGNGDDHIDAGENDDTVNAGRGDDTIDAGPGFDNTDGGRGYDSCIATEVATACEV